MKFQNSLYHTLDNYISNQNKKYKKISQTIYKQEKEHEANNCDKIQTLKRKRLQFIHDYASELDTLVWDNMTLLTSHETPVFDLVPPIVYNKLRIVTTTAIEKISKTK